MGSGLFSIITQADDDSDSSSVSYDDDDDDDDDEEYSSELVDLGITESVPPDDVVEAL